MYEYPYVSSTLMVLAIANFPMFETTKWLKLEARLEARLEAWYRPTNRACKLPTTQLENSLHSIPTGSSYTTTKLQPS